MAAADTSLPPLPPEVVRQQTPASAQFAQGAAGAPGSQNPEALQQYNAGDRIQTIMQNVVKELKEVATIASQAAPSMMPALQKMVQAGSLAMTSLTGSQPYHGQAQPTSSGLAPASEGAAAVSMGG